MTRQLFQDRIGSIEGVCVSDVGEASLGACTQPSDAQLGFSDGTTVLSVSIAQTAQLSREVLSGLLGWSVVVLFAFAALAVAAAWWLAKRSLDPLYDALTRQDRFIAGASHELRTPLTTTRTLLEIPLAQGRVPEDLEPAVRGALAANERSERVIAALLTLARVRHEDDAGRVGRGDGAGRVRGEDGPVELDLGAVVASALAEREPAAAARALRVAPPPGPAAVAAADPELVAIAVGNLIDNAIRHNVDGGEVAVDVGSDERRAWVEVANTGADLSSADLSMLAEPFHRGDDSRLAGEGLGLGLSLVETIARSQGGSLTLTARDGGGLRARLALHTP